MKINKSIKVPEHLTPTVEAYVMEKLEFSNNKWSVGKISIALLAGLMFLWLVVIDYSPNTKQMPVGIELRVTSVMIINNHKAIWLEPLFTKNGG